jgi:protein-L-isoaspartate(D-aspartate) O-methyltransferase
MVDGQVRTADVTDPHLLAAMLGLPRERFFPEEHASLAYLDLDAPINAPGRPDRRLLKPMVLAKLLQAAAITETDRVLDVGCNSGYSTALLAHLAGSVVGLEEDPDLARLAADALSVTGMPNAKIVRGTLTHGCAGEGSAEMVSVALFDQIKDGGRLVGVLGRGPTGKAMLYRRIEGELSGRPVFDAAAAPLPGFAKPHEFVF